MKICGVYLIRNKINGKVYVGSSIDIFRRWKTHQYKLKNKKHHTQKLQNSYNKYGQDAFEYCLAQSATNQKEATALEQKWIEKMDAVLNGYNINPFANNVGALPKTDEHKAKIGKAHLGRKLSEESKQKIRQAHLGKKSKPFTEEHKKRISEAKRGKKVMTEEGRRRLSEYRKSMKGKIKQSEETKRKISLSKIGKTFKTRAEFVAVLEMSV